MVCPDKGTRRSAGRPAMPSTSRVLHAPGQLLTSSHTRTGRLAAPPHETTADGCARCAASGPSSTVHDQERRGNWNSWRAATGCRRGPRSSRPEPAWPLRTPRMPLPFAQRQPSLPPPQAGKHARAAPIRPSSSNGRQLPLAIRQRAPIMPSCRPGLRRPMGPPSRTTHHHAAPSSPPPHRIHPQVLPARRSYHPSSTGWSLTRPAGPHAKQTASHRLSRLQPRGSVHAGSNPCLHACATRHADASCIIHPFTHVRPSNPRLCAAPPPSAPARPPPPAHHPAAPPGPCPSAAQKQAPPVMSSQAAWTFRALRVHSGLGGLLASSHFPQKPPTPLRMPARAHLPIHACAWWA